MPAEVVLFRALQEIRLESMRVLKSWPRLETSIDRWWNKGNVPDVIQARRNLPVIIAPDAKDAIRYAVNSRLIDPTTLVSYGLAMRDRKFSLLGAQVPIHLESSWHSDWRFGHTWKPSYYRDYDFYGREKNIPYDVKLPWELSRLGFLVPILQCDVFEKETSWTETCMAVIGNWERSNPLAYTVNWFPMEASIRGINLVLTLDMLSVLGEAREEILPCLLRLISKHGEFVWRTLEYTDVRGNHFAANIVALLLFGLALRESYPNADRWVSYARNAIPREVDAQFLEDGVNFEKSIAYHRFVTELFLLAVLSMERSGLTGTLSARNRLRSACRYTAAYMRPDGQAPVVGDNDDARILNFDPVSLRDHRPLIGAGAVVFGDPVLKSAAGAMPAAVPWLLGIKGIEKWEDMAGEHQQDVQFFKDGGIVVVRGNNHFFWMDIGEVGLSGRGGHGHNDLFSFELVLDGVTLIVDPGSYVYTGDPRARDLFRCTSYHNGLCIDNEEIAPMSEMWVIGNHAIPKDIEVIRQGESVLIKARHEGYARLSDPVRHAREIRFEVGKGILDCIDRLESEGPHRAERRLHFHPSVEVFREEGSDGAVLLLCKGRRWVIHHAGSGQVRVDSGWVSPAYGVRLEAPVLVLADTVHGRSELSFRIERFG